MEKMGCFAKKVTIGLMIVCMLIVMQPWTASLATLAPLIEYDESTGVASARVYHSGRFIKYVDAYNVGSAEIFATTYCTNTTGTGRTRSEVYGWEYNADDGEYYECVLEATYSSVGFPGGHNISLSYTERRGLSFIERVRITHSWDQVYGCFGIHLEEVDYESWTKTHATYYN